jgi:hypothetical protein
MNLWRKNSPTPRDLAALADGSISAGRRERVERQLAASPELQADIAAQLRAIAAVRHAAGERAPHALRERVTRVPARRWQPPRGVLRAGALATVAAATVALVAVLALGTGTPGSPTVADAAVFAGAPPELSVVQPDRSSKTLPGPRADGLAYPNWEPGYGYRAVGERTDRRGGHVFVTVFYMGPAGRVAYTIASGSALGYGSPARTVNANRARLTTLSAHGRLAVTWLRAGHTCVLVGSPSELKDLLALASSKGAGAKHY